MSVENSTPFISESQQPAGPPELPSNSYQNFDHQEDLSNPSPQPSCGELIVLIESLKNAMRIHKKNFTRLVNSIKDHWKMIIKQDFMNKNIIFHTKTWFSIYVRFKNVKDYSENRKKTENVF